MTETDKEFLTWLYFRLIYVYKESENTDFVQRLKRMCWRKINES